MNQTAYSLTPNTRIYVNTLVSPMVPIGNLSDKWVLVKIHDQGGGGKQTLTVWFVSDYLFGLQRSSRRTEK